MPLSPLPGLCLGFRLFGIPTWLHWTFPGVGLGIGVPLGVGALFIASDLALALFAWSVLAVTVVVFVHEFGHALAAKLLSIEVHGLCFAAGGGCCLVADAQSQWHQLLFSAAGLFAQLLLLGFTVSLRWEQGAGVSNASGAAVFSAVNALLIVANAWPTSNSDGERVVRALRVVCR